MGKTKAYPLLVRGGVFFNIMDIIIIENLKRIRLLYLVIYLLFSSCYHPAKIQLAETFEDKNIREIVIMENISRKQKINLSTIASDIEYCVLETDKNCFVTPNMSIYCSKDYIVAIGNS